jgi:HSP20 family protein
MSSVTRWDPVRDMTSLRDAMSQLFEQAVMRPDYSRWNLTGGYGAMNVWEANGKYFCQFLLPGVDPEAIEVSARQNTLTIKATVPELLSEEESKNTSFLVREFGSGEFIRSISFPKDVKGDAIEASYDQGVLTLEIPLAEHAQPKRISVRSGALKKGQEKPQVVEERQTPTLRGAQTGAQKAPIN